jgi:hypothetical protein
MTRNRRLWIGITVGVVVALLSVATVSLALAQGPDAETPPVDCPGFVDEDGDGVCDSRGSDWRNGLGRGFAMADGDGVCEGFVDEDGDGVCDNFVDEDGDGVCDSRGGGWSNGRGRRFVGTGGYGMRDNLIDENGDGVCDNFIDEDGDGVCDGFSPAPGAGRGRGGRFSNRGYGQQSGGWQ